MNSPSNLWNKLAKDGFIYISFRGFNEYALRYPANKLQSSIFTYSGHSGLTLLVSSLQPVPFLPLFSTLINYLFILCMCVSVVCLRVHARACGNERDRERETDVPGPSRTVIFF